MSSNVRLLVIGALILSALSVSVFCQAQNKHNKINQANGAGLQKTMYLPKATSVPLPPGVQAARRALRAPSERFAAQARSLLAAGDLAGAEQAALRALEATPVIEGQKRPLHTVPLLLGDISLRQGKYEKALQWYLPSSANTWRSGLNLDVALCYARLGNYEAARRFYLDQSILQYSSIKPADLPGTGTPQSLEASILMARGLDAFFSGQKQDALNDLDAAGKLAPRNGLIPYYAGMSLIHMNRGAEAEPYFRRAAQYGRGKMVGEAQNRLEGIAGWRKTHP